MKTRLLVGVAFVLFSTPAAWADTFNFVMTGAATASGTLTTSPAMRNGLPPCGNVIVDITGTLNGAPITFVSTDTNFSCLDLEAVFIFDGQFNFVPEVANTVFAAGGSYWSFLETDFPNDPGAGNIFLFNDTTNKFVDGALFMTLTPVESIVSTPEPSAGLLLGVGVIALWALFLGAPKYQVVSSVIMTVPVRPS